ncbi:hypothetical protein ABFS82_14G240900 [Erythranthe guttata]|uniref:HMA domain-containing protein n=1 Tax=Erythranthe guttata TaxID=4155 RepID=A0A022R813_ERYGU|nr:PREDICTED: putative histone-lysine N-methyltransferase 1 [Erythranthe guttata]EYU36154.1 hypothetical protein MIMGU_mgv1a011101mg [Erythranthe guttata]|eukprot:XP_012838599.1 PREDICTED: putative histone-lysine N-methyltransferase 1 [Erythranthe guttata]
MGEKNKNNQGEQKDGNNNNKNNGGGKNNATVVLKTDLHCDGCASKIIKCIHSFGGVDSVTIGEGEKITVVGNVDPAKLREKLELKTHKKVELLSPHPKKDGDNKGNGNGKENAGGGGNGKQEMKNESKDQKSNEKSDEKKKPNQKEPPVTTAVLKVHLHCDGCIQKIYKTISKTKGYKDMEIDKQKDLVRVTGAMDMKALAENLQKHLKKNVEIVPSKKENENKEKGGGGGGGDEKMEGNKMMQQQQQQSQMVGPNPYPVMYGPGGVFGDEFHQYHAPQMFSDENPNACTVM